MLRDMVFTRGDTNYIYFTLLNNGENIILDENDTIIFSVSAEGSDEYVIQKTLLDGITGDGYGNYTVTIDSTDTENIPFQNYDYDIQTNITTNDKTVVSTILKGAFILTGETTVYGGTDASGSTEGSNPTVLANTQRIIALETSLSALEDRLTALEESLKQENGDSNATN